MLEGRATVQRAQIQEWPDKDLSKGQQRQNRSPVLEQHSPLEQYRLEVR